MTHKTILFGLYITLLLSFFSCEMKKDLMGEVDKPTTGGGANVPLKDAGLLDLELKPHKEPTIDTKGNISGSDVVVLDVNEFAVDILDSIGDLVKHYPSYADFKTEGGLLLSAGTYSIRATLGNDVNAGYDAPFYSGTNTCEVTPKEVVKVITDCVLSNKKVVFRCSKEFLAEFKDDYSIVLNNGNGVLQTSKDESRTAYLKNTGSLEFTAYVTTRKGNKALTYNFDMGKDEQVQEYNNILVDLKIVSDSGIPEPGDPDDPNNPGEPGDPGDPEEPSGPNIPVSKPIIKVDISLIEKEYIIEIPSSFVESEDPEEPSDPGGDGGGTATKPSIKGDGFNIDNAIEVPISNPNKVVKVSIDTPGKLAALNVEISENLWPALKLVGLDPKFDMCNPTAEQKTALAAVGLPLPTPGATTNVFDITTFVPAIAILGPGTYEFKITAKDEANQSVSKKLIIKMTSK